MTSAVTSLKSQVRLEEVISKTLRAAPARYPGGREYLFHCPWHADAHPSLQVNPDKQRYYCHPCGLSGDAIDWLREFLGLSWREALTWIRIRGDELATGRWGSNTPIIRRSIRLRTPPDRRSRGQWIYYRYHDADGRETYQVVRTPDKQFLFRRRDPRDTSRWIWSGEGVARHVYQLHLLQGLPVAFIVEGEKDALALWDLGLPATTNPSGAGKWCDEYSEQLVEAGVERVVIFPDNDRVGREHARRVRASCREHWLRARIVKLSGLPPKGDVSDYIAAGHRRSAFAEYLSTWW